MLQTKKQKPQIQFWGFLFILSFKIFKTFVSFILSFVVIFFLQLTLPVVIAASTSPIARKTLDMVIER